MAVELVALCDTTLTLTVTEQVSASLVISEVTAVDAVGERLGDGRLSYAMHEAL